MTVAETYYTDREAALALNVSPRSVQRYCSDGKLPGAFKEGRSWRIPAQALRAFQLSNLDERPEDPVLDELRAANEAIVHLGERVDVSERVDLGASLDLPAVEQELMQLVPVLLATVKQIKKIEGTSAERTSSR